jgi:hypothetical protein
VRGVGMEAHLIVVNLDPSLGGPFLCKCGAVPKDAAAGLHHVLFPADDVDQVDFGL